MDNEKMINGKNVDCVMGERLKANFDPITGQPIVPQIPPSPSLPKPPSTEISSKPFTPPSFRRLGEFSDDDSENPFKPI